MADHSLRQMLAPIYSRYAQRVLQAQPELQAVLTRAIEGAWTAHALSSRCHRLCVQSGLVGGLRQLRMQVLLSLMERDLQGLADLNEVMRTMSLLAELTLRYALQVNMEQLCARYGTPRGAHSGVAQVLSVVGMGKLGGCELNVSSDIDLIYLYEEDGMTDGSLLSEPIANHVFFEQLARQLTHALAEVNEDGFVFRVDLRLRPNGDAGFLVCNFAMLEEYFRVQAREWERYAWTKARLLPLCAQAAKVGVRLEEMVRQFVYRPYLDFGVIAALRTLHKKICAHGALQRGRYVTDIKRGPGGIRAIEFIVQTFQLIRAGQDYNLRSRSTLAMLEKLAQTGLMGRSQAKDLSRAYLFLRRLEHRLQYMDDAQTHCLPNDVNDQAQLAQAMDCADYPALLLRLAAVRHAVSQQFDVMFSDKCLAVDVDSLSLWDHTPTQVVMTDQSNQISQAMHALIPLLRRVQTSTRYLGLKHTYRQQFDVLMRRVLVHVQEQDAPYTTMVRVLALFEAINARRSYFSLLLEYPQVLVRAIQILAASGWAATYLTQNPQLLDTLLQEVDLEAVDYWQQFSITLRERLFAAGGDVELQVDALRHAQHAQTFRILLQDLQGKLSVERVADHLSALADRVIDLTLETVWPLLAGQHLVTPRFAVIAYGRLGGKELGYASDLDLIFLYDDPDENAPQIYTALARKLITWLTSHTGAGLLYDIDTRLRPNGAEGLLVTDLAAFRRYQFRETDNSAWVWEHQALTRARFCAGDSTIGQAFEAIREQVLRQPREVLVLRKEIVAMRERVRKTYAHASDAFDVKHGRGGMVDVEFVVQYLVLLYSKDYPQLMGNVGNIGLLRLAAQAKLIDPVLAENVALAYRTFRAWQHRQRLDGIKQACIADTEGVVERHAVQFLWKKILMESSAV